GGFIADSLGSLGRTTIVTFGEDEWGELYVSDYSNGGIYRFKGDSCSPVAFISNKDTIFNCDTISVVTLRTPAGNGFHYKWYANGVAVNGNDNDTLLITKGGDYYVMVTNRGGCTATSNSVHVSYVTCTGLNTLSDNDLQVTISPDPNN